MAAAYAGLNDVTEAIKIFREILLLRLAALGPEHPDTQSGEQILAKIEMEDGEQVGPSKVSTDISHSGGPPRTLGRQRQIAR